MPYTQFTPREVEARGEAIYRRRIRDKVSPAYTGQFLVIDIQSGAYEINGDDLIATQRLLAKYPRAVIYGLRIGYPTAYRIGRKSSQNQQ